MRVAVEKAGILPSDPGVHPQVIEPSHDGSIVVKDVRA